MCWNPDERSSTVEEGDRDVLDDCDLPGHGGVLSDLQRQSGAVTTEPAAAAGGLGLAQTASIQLASTLATKKMVLPQSESGWTRWILHL